MTSEEFKNDTGLVTGWRQELQGNQLVKSALESVINASPLHKQYDGPTTDTDALIRHGKLLGYEEAIKNLFDLANLTKLPEQLRPTYGVTQNAK